MILFNCLVITFIIVLSYDCYGELLYRVSYRVCPTLKGRIAMLRIHPEKRNRPNRR